MAVFHQSELTAWNRCPAAANYERRGAERTQLSGTAYGSVMHYAVLEVFERQRHEEGVSLQQATAAALASFRTYWHPLKIHEICEPVTEPDGWMRGHTFNSLLRKGEEQILAYAELVSGREEQVLATEIGFQVPITGTFDERTGQPHVLAGTIDRLALVRKAGNVVVEVGDVKTGKDYAYLRQNMQFHAYTYATTRPEFWNGWGGEDGFGHLGPQLYEQYKDCARKGTWINMTKMSFQDAGWRGPKDWHRFALAINELAKAYEHDVFPFNLSGSTCTFCDFKRVCGGVGVADDEHGAPTAWRGKRPGTTPGNRNRKKAA